MENDESGWESHFPMQEAFEDFAGRQRSFTIDCYFNGLGYTVRAREETSERDGYEFGCYSETSPWGALGRLRAKVSKALATRHLSGAAGAYSMLHDTLAGHITWDSEDGTAVVVDGVPLRMDDLASILSTHEGFWFELRIVDSLE